MRDAEVLLAGKRFDGAFYTSGYAVELALKARICRTLKWQGFPDSPNEFKGLQSLKTHDLPVLLKLSGIEDRVHGKHLADWNVVSNWNPEIRYQAIGLSSPKQVANMLSCVKRLLEVL